MFSLLISLLLSVVSSQLMYKVYKTSWVFMLYVQLVYKAFWNLSFLWLNSWPYLDNYKHKGKRWQPGWVRNKLTGHYITTCCPFWSTQTWQHHSFLLIKVCGVVFCCWTQSASRLDMLCMQRCSSAHLGCNELTCYCLPINMQQGNFPLIRSDLQFLKYSELSGTNYYAT